MTAARSMPLMAEPQPHAEGVSYFALGEYPGRLHAFANAILHCSSCAEVAVTLNEALSRSGSTEEFPSEEF
jgi:hypothetical protein